MSLDLFKEVSIKYYDSLKQGNPEFPFEILPFEFETNSKDIFWGTYEEEFTRTIINLFNKFATCLYRIYILEKIISQYEDKDLLSLRSEFIHIPLHYCLNKPYEFVGRVQYCCIRLCNQANQSVFKLGNQIDPDEDVKYDFKLLKTISKSWKTRERLLQAIDSVGNWNQEFMEETKGYRNRSQHQFPPELDVGLTNTITERYADSNEFLENLPDELKQKLSFGADEKVISYGFGGEQPLQTKDMIPVLIKQGEEMRTLFLRYWDLVQEQHTAMSAL